MRKNSFLQKGLNNIKTFFLYLFVKNPKGFE